MPPNHRSKPTTIKSTSNKSSQATRKTSLKKYPPSLLNFYLNKPYCRSATTKQSLQATKAPPSHHCEPPKHHQVINASHNAPPSKTPK
uniref:Ovule protein n=1 Tax=Meloidogyne incognita TaxID=6306 RepID=A0A914KHZ2_MELIC